MRNIAIAVFVFVSVFTSLSFSQITDNRVVVQSDQNYRPLSEDLRAVDNLASAIIARWYIDINTLTPNTVTDTLIDNLVSRSGAAKLTGADLNSFINACIAYREFYATYKNVLEKLNVRIRY